MDIKIIQWNIGSNILIDQTIIFLKSIINNDSIICCQNINKELKNILINELKPSDYSYSLSLRKPGEFDIGLNKLGVLTMVKKGKIISEKLLSRSPFESQCLLNEIRINDNNINILNFCGIKGSEYKKTKFYHFASIAEFLKYNALDFFSCSAHEPLIDSVDIKKQLFSDLGDEGRNASLIFGKNKVHKLSDSSRTFYKNQLQYSYKKNRIGKRYDHIYYSEKWEVLNVKYLYNKSILLGSKHSLIFAEYKTN